MTAVVGTHPLVAAFETALQAGKGGAAVEALYLLRQADCADVADVLADRMVSAGLRQAAGVGGVREAAAQ